MSRPDKPFGPEFFERDRTACGDGRFVLRIDALTVELVGLAHDTADRLGERFDRYHDPNVAEPTLRCVVSRDDDDYFITPPDRPEPNPVRLALDGGRVRYLAYRVSGWFDRRGGVGAAVLASGGYEPPERALENFLRTAIAWLAASRGGALVHAASAVVDGHGFLFYGPSGAGKSTLSEASRRGAIVSDDLSLVLPREHGPGLDLVGSPFRGTYEGGEPVVGRFPVRAGFRLVQADRAEVVEVARVRAFAELVGNLPFVAEAFPDDPGLFASAQAAFAGVPLHHLHFTRDDSYWRAIERAGLLPSAPSR